MNLQHIIESERRRLGITPGVKVPQEQISLKDAEKELAEFNRSPSFANVEVGDVVFIVSNRSRTDGKFDAEYVMVNYVGSRYAYFISGRVQRRFRMVDGQSESRQFRAFWSEREARVTRTVFVE